MAEKIRNFIVKLQNLPETKKKIIIAVVIVVIGLVLGSFWLKSAANNISKIGEFGKQIDLPKLEMPQEVVDSLSKIEKEAEDIKSEIATDASNWKTYTNEEYGFEIKYHPNLFLEENYSNNDFIFAKLKDNEFYPFWVYSGNSENERIILIMNPKLSDYTQIENGKLNVNGIDWSTIEKIYFPSEDEEAKNSSLIFYTQRENSTYILECVNCNTNIFEDDGSYRRLVFDQILSTFKFTDSNI